jgi:phage terminase large subunit
VKTKVLEASLFKPLPAELKEQLLLSGVVPVNDILIPHWDNTNKINLFYGSYGSGKSVFIVDVLIEKCQHDKYFRCYFGRKVFETVRGTVFKTITDRIKELKREKLFEFSEKPNGSMIIRCKESGNEFYPFGANDASSLKSIKDPTHFFCEEMDQFSFTDFGFIYSRLRTEKAICQFYGAFNTERIFQSHWIRKVLFDGEYASVANRVKVNYYNNHFINHEDYEGKLRLIANGNIAVFNAIANGEWGVVRTGGEFFNQFDESKHVAKVEYGPGVVYVSLDENVNPYVTQTVWQVEGTAIRQVHEILSISPHNNAPKSAAKFCDWLDHVKHKDVVFVCGDPSASKRSTVDENSSSFYEKYIAILTSRGYKVVNKVMKSAPEVALSASFINAIYENKLYGWSITISEKCFSSIEDYILVKEDAEGKMFKGKEKDPVSGITYEQRGHISDSKRYLVLTVMAKQFEEYKGLKKSNLKGKMGFFR